MKKVINTVFSFIFVAFALACIYVSNRDYTAKADDSNNFVNYMNNGQSITINGGNSYYVTLPADTSYDVKSGFAFTLLNGVNYTIDLNGSTLNFGENYNCRRNEVNSSSYRYNFRAPFYLWANSKITLKNGTINYSSTKQGDSGTFYGGIIGSFNSSIILENMTINYSDSATNLVNYGGVIAASCDVDKKEITLKNTTINGAKAKNGGAAIYLKNNSEKKDKYYLTLNISSDSVIKNCSVNAAGVFGGAVHIGEGVHANIDGQIIDNTIIEKKYVYSDKSVSYNSLGAGIYSESDSLKFGNSAVVKDNLVKYSVNNSNEYVAEKSNIYSTKPILINEKDSSSPFTGELNINSRNLSGESTIIKDYETLGYGLSDLSYIKLDNEEAYTFNINNNLSVKEKDYVIVTYDLNLNGIPENKIKEKITTSKSYLTDGIKVSYLANDLAGYRQVKWNTKPDGTGDDVAFGSVVPVDDINDYLITDLTLYAIYEEKSYIIHYNDNAPSGKTSRGEMENQTVGYHTPISLSKNVFEVDGYSFNGWTSLRSGAGTKYTDEQTVSELKDEQNGVYELYAQWAVINYTVTFESEGKVLSTKTNYKYGNTVTVPANPTKEADMTYTYEFAGWDKEITPVTEDVTYTAVFNPIYIDYDITFIKNGQTVESTKYHYGDEIVVPSDLDYVDGNINCVLSGWYPEFNPVCEGDATYIAMFSTEVKKFDVSFYNEDNELIETNKYNAGTSVDPISYSPKEPRFGYRNTFKGWVDENGESINFKNINDNINAYPNVEEKLIEYTITYVLNNGTAENLPTKYNSLEATQIPNLTKEGSEFIGWTGTLYDAPTKDVVIEAGSTGNIELTAVFYVNSKRTIDSLNNSVKITVDNLDSFTDDSKIVIESIFGVKDIDVSSIEKKNYDLRYFNILIMNNGQVVDYDGSVTVTITKEYLDTDFKSCSVYSINDDNTLTGVKLNYDEDGNLQFDLNHMGRIIIQSEAPQTQSISIYSIVIVLLVLFMVLEFVLIFVLFSRSKRNNNQE